MVKMPCLFVREFHGKQSFTILSDVTPGCEWVLAGEGSASRKRDGTACMFRTGAAGTGQLFKRYDAKKDHRTGEFRAPPLGSIPCDEPDPVTGHWPHWVLIGDHDYWHREAFFRHVNELTDGTYELCGPKIGANPEGFGTHTLVRHGSESCFPLRTFDGLRGYLSDVGLWEGIVFAHPDGRFAKIRRKDFGLAWPIRSTADGGAP